MTLPGSKLLVVEDDQDTRNNLCDILQQDGFHIDAVASASDAVQRATYEDYMAVILDWRLSDTTAEELLPRLRRLIPEAGIIVATGSADLENAIAALRHGAVDYILKPIQVDLLRSSVRRTQALYLANQRARQAERLAAIGTVVASVAHESRNALQRIMAQAEFIRLNHPDDAELMEDTSIIEDASRQLRSHFEELREFVAPMVLEKKHCCLRRLTQQVWLQLQSALEYPQAQLCLPESSVECLVDPQRMKQVLRNLFENSLSLCPEPARIEIEWSVNSDENSALLMVTFADNGPGFSVDARASAFEPFYTTKGNGTGLGLSICRQIIEAHGGSICIDPSYVDGAAIHFSLPLPIKQTKPALVGA